MAGRVSEDEVLADLKRVARQLGHPPTVAEYRENGQYSCPTVAKHFGGSFVSARAAALDVEDDRRPEISSDKLLSDIKRVAEKVDREPSKTDYKERGDYALSTITYRFESWITAKNEAGVYDGLDEAPIKDELLTDMRRVDQEIDGPLSQVTYNEHGKWTTRPVKDRFESWEKACQKANVSRPDKGPRTADDKELLEDIQNVADELDHVPSRAEYNKNGQFSRQMAISRFGSWPKAVEKAGYDPLPPGGQSGDRNALWVDEDPYYGPNWDEHAEEIRKRDDFKCQNCGMSNIEHIRKYRSKLNVHHIKKIRKFDSYEAANTGENLITLCNSCHSTYEHLPTHRAKVLLGDE
ncbi:HNH endonuclease [Halorubrum sp. Boch-26]|uniref:homing endonuclease associated repeat-containing protein n=1 Tax=Halorubrum sp. Boch-26 TaxID=2994426 RepID=UPI002469BDFF|nr:HNH endonuclease [Halorubrum sp. Boch-26]